MFLYILGQCIFSQYIYLYFVRKILSSGLLLNRHNSLLEVWKLILYETVIWLSTLF